MIDEAERSSACFDRRLSVMNGDFDGRMGVCIVLFATTPSTAANATISFFEIGKFFRRHASLHSAIARGPGGAAGDIGAVKNGDRCYE